MSCLLAGLAACSRTADSGIDPGGERAALVPLVDPADFEPRGEGLLRARPGSGWEPLLADEGLEGWEQVGGAPEGAVVEGGVLAFTTAGGGGYLRTLEDFRDLRLRLDFKLGRMANSGVFLRGDRAGGDPAYTGCEVQLLDDFNWERVTGTTLEPYQFTGGLYGSVAPGTKALRALGQWNTLVLEYRGTHLRVELNGELLYAVDTLEVPGKPFAERAPEGFIGLQRHAPERVGPEPWAWFRNVFVQRL